MTFRFRLAVILSATFLMVAPSLTFGNVFDNIHTVEKDQFYRSSQLEKPKLEALILERGIRTIINLRGDKTGEAWYDDEALIAKKNNVLLVNIGMSAKRLPHKKDLIALLDAFKNSPRPILIHCRAGVDRTGEASALWQMISMGKSKAEALKMLTPKYGHFEFLMPAKRYFIRDVWQGLDWAYWDYNPCEGKYKYYDVNSSECQSDGGNDDDGDT